MPMLEDTRWPDGEEPFADAVLEESESEAAGFLHFIKGLILFWGFPLQLDVLVALRHSLVVVPARCRGSIR